MKTAETPLTFQWPDTRQVSFALPGFIALSGFLHAASFYLFQIAYPPSAHIVPPPAQISLVASGSPENDQLLRWIDAEDPQIATRTPEVTPANLFDLPYESSFAQVHAQPQTVAETDSPFSFPSAEQPLALIQSAAPRNPASTSVVLSSPTMIRFSSPLSGRAIPPSDPLAFHTATTELHPARFLIGVTDRGEIQYVFLQTGSGDKAIDDAAAAQLHQRKFAPAAEPLSWGMAIFFWGADAFASAPKPGRAK